MAVTDRVDAVPGEVVVGEFVPGELAGPAPGAGFVPKWQGRAIAPSIGGRASSGVLAGSAAGVVLSGQG